MGAEAAHSEDYDNVGRDTERQRQHGSQRKRGRLYQLPQGMTKILEEPAQYLLSLASR